MMWISTASARARRGGFRTIVPWLRGFGQRLHRFDAAVWQIAAMAQDALDLADALGIKRFRSSDTTGARIATSSPLPRQNVSTHGHTVARLGACRKRRRSIRRRSVSVVHGHRARRQAVRSDGSPSHGSCGYVESDGLVRRRRSRHGTIVRKSGLARSRSTRIVRWGQAEPIALPELEERQRGARSRSPRC
jgi:hypothetical protein